MCLPVGNPEIIFTVNVLVTPGNFINLVISPRLNTDLDGSFSKHTNTHILKTVKNCCVWVQLLYMHASYFHSPA